MATREFIAGQQPSRSVMSPKLVSTLLNITMYPQQPLGPLQPLNPNVVMTGGGVAGEAFEAYERCDDEAAVVSLDLIRNRRPFKCQYVGCLKTFKNPQTMNMHHKSHTAGSARRQTDPYSLVPSILKAGYNKKIPSRCPTCYKTFVGLYEVRRHFGRKHSTGEKKYKCNKCEKRFYIEVDLRDHKKLCGKPIRCKCGTPFAFLCNLRAHQKKPCADSPPAQEELSKMNQAVPCRRVGRGGGRGGRRVGARMESGLEPQCNPPLPQLAPAAAVPMWHDAPGSGFSVPFCLESAWPPLPQLASSPLPHLSSSTLPQYSSALVPQLASTDVNQADARLTYTDLNQEDAAFTYIEYGKSDATFPYDHQFQYLFPDPGPGGLDV